MLIISCLIFILLLKLMSPPCTLILIGNHAPRPRQVQPSANHSNLVLICIFQVTGYFCIFSALNKFTVLFIKKFLLLVGGISFTTSTCCPIFLARLPSSFAFLPFSQGYVGKPPKYNANTPVPSKLYGKVVYIGVNNRGSEVKSFCV